MSLRTPSVAFALALALGSLLSGCRREEPAPPTPPVADVGERAPGAPDAAAPADPDSSAAADAATPPSSADAASVGRPDAAAPGPDATAAAGPDAARPGPDAARPGPDAARPGPDAAEPGPDAGAPQAQAPFRFVAWGDTKSGTSALAALSRQVAPLSPDLTIYVGDLESSGFTSAGIATWKKALEGDTSGATSNGLLSKTFAVRGNHDTANTSGWQGFFDVEGNAARLGAANLSQLATDLTYSFDYRGVHFVGMDVASDVNVMTSAQLQWLDQDLTAAEARGVSHTFLFWHGPLWPVANHCCSASKPEAIDVINRHPSVSATFHGHEHVNAYTHLDRAEYSNLTHEFEQFHAGRAGASGGTCQDERVDWCLDDDDGFMLVTVDGLAFRVDVYREGQSAPVKSLAFVK